MHHDTGLKPEPNTQTEVAQCVSHLFGVDWGEPSVGYCLVGISAAGFVGSRGRGVCGRAGFARAVTVHVARPAANVEFERVSAGSPSQLVWDECFIYAAVGFVAVVFFTK